MHVHCKKSKRALQYRGKKQESPQTDPLKKNTHMIGK